MAKSRRGLVVLAAAGLGLALIAKSRPKATPPGPGPVVPPVTDARVAQVQSWAQQAQPGVVIPPASMTFWLNLWTTLGPARAQAAVLHAYNPSAYP